MIRPAEPADAPAIRAVHEAAFPTPAEADLVEALVAAGDAVVSLVDAANGAIAGHVLLSRMRVGGDGRAYRALGLAPVAVLPGHQGAKIGSRLIEAALAVARATGEELVFVLGEPSYYTRFGFATETAGPFVSPYAGSYFMALKLDEALALPKTGEAAYASAFAGLD